MRLALALLFALALAPSAQAGEWLAGDLHAHTTYSHDSYGGPGDDNTGPEELYTAGHTVASQFSVAASRGLDFLAITDHNDVRSQSDPGFGSSGVIGLPGYENSLQGHAQMLGARRVYDNGDGDATAASAVAKALRRDGGVFQINHPGGGDWGYGYDVRPDTVEVWNIARFYQPPLPSGSDNDDAVRFWEGWLDRGRRIGATGGSDNHYLATTAVQGVGQPTTWVWAKQRTPAGVLTGLRAGRTSISDQPPGVGPELRLKADGNGDGTFEARIGATVRPGSKLRVRTSGAVGTFARLITDGGRQAAGPVAITVPGQRIDFSVPEQATWVRAELFDPDLAAERGALCDGLVGSGTTYCRSQLLVRAMTSPIYLRP